MKTRRIVLYLPAFNTILVPATVYAYIDPVSGSMLLQAIVAAVVGIGIGAKLYWSRLKNMFGLSGKENSPSDKQENKDSSL